MKRVTITWGSIVVVSAAMALGAGQHDPSQHHDPSPYVAEANRPIKALSREEVNALLNGAGMGFAKAAELNHYPGPRHVLDMAGPLALTADQKSAAERAFTTMDAEAKELGRKILAAEEVLDRAFASGAIRLEEVDARTAEIARLYGALRAAHLRAHVAVRSVLTEAQVAAYDRLRGYAVD